jgi:SAM-dependent methyltransferase
MASAEDVYDDDYLLGDSSFGANFNDPILAEIARRAAVRRFEVIERTQRPGTVLDVGCGTGIALHVAESRGWRGVGVEPVEASAARARSLGLDVRTGTLAEAQLDHGSFDLVCAWHVLEHFADPIAFLHELAAYARPGGLVAVEVPNWWHADRRSQAGEWEHLRPLEHVAHYTPLTLRRTMRRARAPAADPQRDGRGTNAARRPPGSRLRAAGHRPRPGAARRAGVRARRAALGFLTG